MTRAFIDTNIVLRFLTGQPPEMAERVRALFARAEKGELTLVLDDIVVAEVVWVLTSFYRLERTKVSRVLQQFLAHEAIEMPRKEDMLAALMWFAQYNIDFTDALLSVRAYRAGLPLFSFDRDFDKVPGLQRLEP